MTTADNRKIEALTAELLAADPTLDPAKLKAAVAALMSARPSAEVSSKFAEDLRLKLDQRILQLKTERKQPFHFNLNFISMNKFKLTLASAAIVAIIALVASFTLKPVNFPSGPQIARTGDAAFGKLDKLTAAVGKGGGAGGGQAATAPDGRGGGGGFAPVNYRYVYKGDTFTIDDSKMTVYKRQKGFTTDATFNSLLGKFSVSSFNINKFKDAKLQYVSGVQDVAYGYAINLDFREGTANIAQNYERWPQTNPSRLELGQVPSDEHLIALADQFLAEYGISKANFASPIVDNGWRREYDKTADKNNFYIPTMLAVIYPLKIDGHEIYDEGGNPTGMYVSIDIPSDKVSNVNELSNQRYLGSEYDVVRDTKKLINVAESGQAYPYPTMDPNAKTQTLNLGTPVIQYVRMWMPTDTGAGSDLYVPSLLFPILNAPDYYAKNLVVPLVKDILDARQNQPPVQIMK